MLSKSSARLFFIGGTTVFSLVFLALTVDTIAEVPERSNADMLNADVVTGHEIWTDNNCMGCHTILGEGAYYAPELTKVIDRRGKPWLKVFLKDPQAMFPGRRKMVQYDFTETEIDQLLAFFDWIGKIDTNGFPAEPDLAPKAQSGMIADGSVAHVSTGSGGPVPQMFRTICVSCHAVGGKGGKVGPALDTVATRYTPAELDKWLADPQAYKPGTAMPNLQLTPEVRQELVTYLIDLGKGE